MSNTINARDDYESSILPTDSKEKLEKIANRIAIRHKVVAEYYNGEIDFFVCEDDEKPGFVEATE